MASPEEKKRRGGEEGGEEAGRPATVGDILPSLIGPRQRNGVSKHHLCHQHGVFVGSCLFVCPVET
jgi:hypothetical protein